MTQFLRTKFEKKWSTLYLTDPLVVVVVVLTLTRIIKSVALSAFGFPCCLGNFKLSHETSSSQVRARVRRVRHTTPSQITSRKKSPTTSKLIACVKEKSGSGGRAFFSGAVRRTDRSLALLVEDLPGSREKGE